MLDTQIMKHSFIFSLAIILLSACESTITPNEKPVQLTIENPAVFHLGQTQTLQVNDPDNFISSLSVRNVPTGWEVSANPQNKTLAITCSLGAYQSGEYDFDVIAKSADGKEISTKAVISNDVSIGSPYYNGEGVVGVIVALKSASNNVGIIASVQHSHSTNWYTYSDWIAGKSTTGAWRMPTAAEGERIFSVYAGDEGNTNKGTKIEQTLSKYGDYALNGDVYWSSTEYKSSTSSSVYYRTFGDENSGARPCLAKSTNCDGIAIITF